MVLSNLRRTDILGNTGQTNALESWGEAKKFLLVLLNEAVRGDMDLETLKSRRDRVKMW